MKRFHYALFFITLTSVACAEGNNWGARQLEKIVQREHILFQNAPEASEAAARSEWERKVVSLITDYQNFLAANPESLEGTILLGKLLRNIGETKPAYAVFTRANAINPKIAVVKQELGNCLAELGEGPMALWFFMEAVSLSPQTALYHYQLGELIDIYENQLLLNAISSGPSLDRQKTEAFKQAKLLDSNNKDFAWRYAQVFYDILLPDAKKALEAWNDLETSATTSAEKEAIALHQAYWLLELKENRRAEMLLTNIKTPSLQATRNQLWRRLHLI